ncbi:UNVERIFIED_CONTAM: hypothetical protein HDU68_008484 [Siphonaria sp. JEL0065]|nr:hypothetical protein HDU68_008484 [Siphonaria sp. JEL0065]
MSSLLMKCDSYVLQSDNSAISGCQNGFVSGVLCTSDTCQGTPLASGRFPTIYYDKYTDSLCKTRVMSKSPFVLKQQGGSKCTNKVTATFIKNFGFNMQTESMGSCGNPIKLYQTAASSKCVDYTACDSVSFVNGLASENICQAFSRTALELDYVGASKTKFGSKPFVVFEFYADENSKIGVPVSRGAAVFDTCLPLVMDARRFKLKMLMGR